MWGKLARQWDRGGTSGCFLQVWPERSDWFGYSESIAWSATMPSTYHTVGSGILVKFILGHTSERHIVLHWVCPWLGQQILLCTYFGSDNTDSLSPGVPAEFHHSSPSAFLTWEIWNSPDLPVVWHPYFQAPMGSPQKWMLSEVTVAMLERNLLRLHQNFNDKAMLTEHHEEIWMRIWVCPAMGIQQWAYRYTPKNTIFMRW